MTDIDPPKLTPEGEAVFGKLEAEAERWNGRRAGLIRRIACALGMHHWWHSQILVGQQAHDICMACAKTRPEKDW
jgi:hypothetical protein